MTMKMHLWQCWSNLDNDQDLSPSSPPPPILLEQRVHRVANIQTSTSCLEKRPNRISRHEKVRKRRCMERRGRRCLDIWEDERRQASLGGDEVMVAPPSSITRMSRPPCMVASTMTLHECAISPLSRAHQ